MSKYNPIFRSSITISNLQPPAPTPPPPVPKLTLFDLTGVKISLIQGEADDTLKKEFGHIPGNPGDLIEIGNGFLARLTPTEFYLFSKAPDGNLSSVATLNEKFAGSFVHATDLTHGKAVSRLMGSQAASLLSKICGLDFENPVFPNGQVAQTSAAKIKTLIARYDEGGTPTYYLHVDRPLGQYFWEVVQDAGQEFGIEVVSNRN
jgi:heterotetrameric sarcosine oxidase gamma subunit